MSYNDSLKEANEALKSILAALKELPTGGINFTTDETLSLSETNVLSVNTASEASEDNTLPITSAAVKTIVGDIEILLETI